MVQLHSEAVTIPLGLFAIPIVTSRGTVCPSTFWPQFRERTLLLLYYITETWWNIFLILVMKKIRNKKENSPRMTL